MAVDARLLAEIVGDDRSAQAAFKRTDDALRRLANRPARLTVQAEDRASAVIDRLTRRTIPEKKVPVAAEDKATSILDRIRNRVLPNKSFSVLAETGAASKALDRLEDQADRMTDRLKTGLLAVGAAGVAMGGLITKSGIGMNAELETSELQFRTLLGSADAAKEHVAGLFQFAKETPFETGPIVTASRLMLTFGGTALASQKNLRLVGDAAAATGSEIDELGFWFGRMYAAMKGGQPFGEARMRLQELAVLSPTAAAELEKLSESGASMDEMWGVLVKDMDRFGGAMALQAASAKGLWSTLKDTFSLGAASLTAPVFDALKRMGEALVAFTSSPAWDDLLAKGRDIFGGVAGFMDRLTAAFQAGGPVAAAQALRTEIQDALGGVDWGALMERVWGGITRSLPRIAAAAGDIIVALADGLKQADWSKISEGLANVISLAMTNLDYATVFQAIATLVITVAPKIIEGLVVGIVKAAAANPLDFALLLLTLGFTPVKMIGAVGKVLKSIPLVGPLAAWVLEGFAQVGRFITEPLWTLFASAGSGIFSGLLVGIVGVWSASVVPWFSGLPGVVAGFFSNAPAWLVAAGVAIMGGAFAGLITRGEDVWGWLAAVPGRVIGFFTDASSWLTDAGYGITDGLRDGIVNAAAGVWAYLAEIPGRVRSAVGDMGGILWDAGASLIRGFIGGIQSMAQQVVNAATSVVRRAISAIWDAIRPGSPSREGFDMGQNLGAGLAAGLLGSEEMVRRAGDALVRAFQPRFAMEPPKPRLPAVAGLRGSGMGGSTGGGDMTVVNLYVGNSVGSKEALVDFIEGSLNTRGQRATGRRRPLYGNW